MSIKNGKASIGDLLLAEFPEQKKFCGEWLTAGSLTMIHARRGIGKTWFAMALAYAIAFLKSFLSWSIPNNARVLYLDFEMGWRHLSGRNKKIDFSENASIDYSGYYRNSEHNLSFISDNGMIEGGKKWNIANPKDQQTIMVNTSHFDVLVIDNLASSMRPETSRDGEIELWNRVQPWLINLRTMGKAVILIHHSGKNLTQRGFSNKEDILDTVINLAPTSDVNPKSGASFDVKFEKNRHFYGAAAESVAVELISSGPRLVWNWGSLETRLSNKAMELKEKGLTVRDIGEVLGLPVSRVKLLLKEEDTNDGGQGMW